MAGPRKDPDDPQELHTHADDIPPLSAREAEAMGLTNPRDFGELEPSQEVVYGDTDQNPISDQQHFAHQAGPDEHL
jgi:hypothetical protein